jgi:hypothetical protein
MSIFIEPGSLSSQFYFNYKSQIKRHKICASRQRRLALLTDLNYKGIFPDYKYFNTNKLSLKDYNKAKEEFDSIALPLPSPREAA